MNGIPPVASDERAAATPAQNIVVRRPAHPVAPARTAEPSDAQLDAAITSANKALARNNIQFSVDRASGKTIVRVTDAQTQQLIRQIPSPEMIELAHAIDRMQGMLLKHEA